ncbi:MAG TPA: hypothetical protein V6C91_05655 [Coleofasciculaceae cyanobacterium]
MSASVYRSNHEIYLKEGSWKICGNWNSSLELYQLFKVGQYMVVRSPSGVPTVGTL